MLNCKQASRLVSQSLDRRLAWRERLSLRLHLAICEACRQFSRQLAGLRRALRHFAQQVENDETMRLPAAARERIRNALREHE